MKRMTVLLLTALMLFSSCSRTETRCARDILEEILTEFPQEDGFLYSDPAEDGLFLTDAMCERLFFDANLSDFRYVRSMACYFSRRYGEGEILILELYDLSHRDAVTALLSRRAEKKENAVLFTNGVYLYLICTKQNEAIKAFLS